MDEFQRAVEAQNTDMICRPHSCTVVTRRDRQFKAAASSKRNTSCSFEDVDSVWFRPTNRYKLCLDQSAAVYEAWDEECNSDDEPGAQSAYAALCDTNSTAAPASPVEQADSLVINPAR